jgi:hypothetical protein
MKIYVVTQLLLIVSIFATLFSGEVEAQKSPDKIADSKLLTIDNFDTPSDQKYERFRSVDTVLSSLGYGIHYRKADAKLSLVPVSEKDKALKIRYDLPPFFSWGNWLSIRKEFKTPKDLSEYDGLEFELKVEVPSDAMLRITLADVENLKDVEKHGSDELFWYDFADDTLENRAQKWVKFRAPFKAFYRSYGEGVRHNDGELDTKKLVAYEINLVSEGGHPKGAILINSLRAYKD